MEVMGDEQEREIAENKLPNYKAIGTNTLCWRAVLKSFNTVLRWTRADMRTDHHEL